MPGSSVSRGRRSLPDPPRLPAPDRTVLGHGWLSAPEVKTRSVSRRGLVEAEGHEEEGLGEPRGSPRSGVVPVTSGSCFTRMRKARRTARRQGHSAPAQLHGRVGRRDKPRRCAPHRAEREGNSGPETKGGSRVGNIRVTRCRLDPGHARVPRPITVRPGRARGLGRRGLARRGGGRGPWGSAA